MLMSDCVIYGLVQEGGRGLPRGSNVEVMSKRRVVICLVGRDEGGMF